MAWRKQGDCEIWMCIGLFVATASLCHCVAQTMNDTSNSSSIREFELRGNSTVVHGKWVNVRKGRILIGRSSPRGAKDVQLPNGTHVDADYQADMGRGDSMQVHSLPRSDSAAVKQLLQMEPKVECTGTSMKLRVQDAVSKPGHALFVDRGSQLSPLPLSKLPVNCGYSLRSTLRGLVLDAPYDGCFVSLEDESYVLSLHWLGLPVRMSCPVMRQSPYNPPMVLCNAVGMEVKMDLSISVNQIKVNYNGHWEPLMEASQRCGFGVVTHPNGVVISICYDPCVQIKDGMFTIELAEDGKVEAYCPQILPSNPVNTQNCGRPIKNISQSKVPPTQFPVYPKNPNSKREPQVSQTPQGQQLHQFPFYQLPPYYQHQLYPPSDPNVNQKPQSQTPKGDVEEVLHPTEPPKPVPSQGQKPQPYKFPIYQLPPYYQHQLFPPSDPNINQKPQSQIPKGDVEEVLNPTEPQKPSSGKPAAPQGQKPLLHQFPFYQLPPYYQHQLFPPSDPNIYQKPQSQTPKGDVEEVLNPTEPQKPSSGKPAAPQGQKPQLHQFPFYQLPPYYQHQLFPPSDPNIYQKPQSQIPKGDVEKVLNPTEPQKPSVPEGPSTGKPAAPHGQKPQLHRFPFYQLPPYYQHQLFPPYDPNVNQKPQSQIPKGDVEEVVNPTEPQKPSTGKPAAPQGQKLKTPDSKVPEHGVLSPYYQNIFYPQSYPKGSSQEQWLPNHEHRPGHVYTESVEKPALESQDTSNVKPSHSGSPSHALQPGVQYSPFVNCPLICPIGVYNCCPPISFHQHYHHILPVVNNTVISPSPIYTGLEFLSSLGDSNVPVLPTASTLKLIDTSEHHDTSVNPAPDVSGEPRKSWSSLASQSIKFGSQPIMQQYFPPPDGNPSSPHLNYPNTPKELGVPMQPYFLPQPAKYQSLPQNPILQYYQRFNLQQQSEPYNQPQRMLTEDVKNQFDPAMQYNFMPYIKQYAQLPSTSRVHNEPEAHGKKQSQSEHLKQDPGKVVDQSSIPYYMLQDGQSPPHKKMLEENSNLSQIQLPLSDSKLSKPQPLEPSFLQPNDYVLLQQGPPWHSPSSSSRSLLPSTGLGDDLDESFPASSQRQQIAKLYNVKKPLKQDGDQMDTLIPSKHNMPRHIGEQSFDSLPFSAPALNGQLQPQLDIFRPKALPDDSKVLHHSPQPSLPRLNSTIELNPMDMSQPNQRNHGRK